MSSRSWVGGVVAGQAAGDFLLGFQDADAALAEGKRTVCGMLSGAGLSRLRPHDRAHWFFSRARWDAGELGLAAARLVVALLAPAGEPVLVAIDDTLFKRF